MQIQKRKLTIKEQIAHSKKNGIKFILCSEDVAEEYLRKNNNYFKLTAYRKNYRKYVGGNKNGQYYVDNEIIKSSFYFLKMVIDNWYPIAYNNTTEKK